MGRRSTQKNTRREIQSVTQKTYGKQEKTAPLNVALLESEHYMYRPAIRQERLVFHENGLLLSRAF